MRCPRTGCPKACTRWDFEAPPICGRRGARPSSMEKSRRSRLPRGCPKPVPNSVSRRPLHFVGASRGGGDRGVVAAAVASNAHAVLQHRQRQPRVTTRGVAPRPHAARHDAASGIALEPARHLNEASITLIRRSVSLTKQLSTSTAERAARIGLPRFGTLRVPRLEPAALVVAQSRLPRCIQARHLRLVDRIQALVGCFVFQSEAIADVGRVAVSSAVLQIAARGASSASASDAIAKASRLPPDRSPCVEACSSGFVVFNDGRPR